eukprot:TRINITY_DN1861_c0_g1_i1.p1 TRINITY_DN1861_c0_g1~~TRINITY_DN1861_c0_g1_i1.p1  ORF type:complete len:139 (-),score=7.55 TRINITY_DN1861_c0_g1_i1:248-664(-)
MAAVVAIEDAVCDCCGLKEECTLSYINRIKERFFGKFLCGLCAEAVKDEIYRAGELIDMEKALQAHMAFCAQFRVASQKTPSVCLVGAVRQLLKRTLVAAGSPRSAPATPRGAAAAAEPEPHVGRISRSESCFSTLAL